MNDKHIGYLKKRIWFFQKREAKINDKGNNYDKTKEMTFTVKEFIDKFGINTECALSGIKINLEHDKDWEIDHIVSISQGGDNSLNNCQILHKSVNQMKHSLDEGRFIELCKMIVERSQTKKRFKRY